ncbi:MAG: hypothetical protein AAB578_06695, partial [Elusimicrobiota bacterium]
PREALPLLGPNVEEDRPLPWGGLFARSIGPHAAATAVFVYAASALLGPCLVRLWAALPRVLSAGAGWAFEKTLWIALAVLIGSLGRRR